MSFVADFQTKTQTCLKKVDAAYGVVGFIAVYFLLIFLNIGGIGQFFANLASLVIPGYYSLQALETKSTADDTQFLTYWVIYASFTVVEFWTNTILYWVPFYWLFKTVFFLYIGLPQYGGSRFIYLNAIRPFSVKVLGINGKPASVNTTLKEKVEVAADNASSTTTGTDL
ncbi:hypothetical protein DV495_002674 [Geotrichum candidum]|nr:hypothetical protein DV495_002674 [Geotrichum candidum]